MRAAGSRTPLRRTSAHYLRTCRRRRCSAPNARLANVLFAALVASVSRAPLCWSRRDPISRRPNPPAAIAAVQVVQQTPSLRTPLRTPFRPPLAFPAGATAVPAAAAAAREPGASRTSHSRSRAVAIAVAGLLRESKCASLALAIASVHEALV